MAGPAYSALLPLWRSSMRPALIAPPPVLASRPTIACTTGCRGARLYLLPAAGAQAADAAAFGSRDAFAFSAATPVHFARGGAWLAGDEGGVKIQPSTGRRRGGLDAQSRPGKIALRPRFTVLASGSFLSATVLSPLAIACASRSSASTFTSDPATGGWYQRDFFAASQPWQRFGVKTDALLRPCWAGSRSIILFAISSLLGGFRCHSARAVAAASAPLPRCTPPDGSTPLPEAGHERYPFCCIKVHGLYHHLPGKSGQSSAIPARNKRPDGERTPASEGWRAAHDEALKYCINCKRCEVACPSDVKIRRYHSTRPGTVRPAKADPLRDAILSHTDLMGTLSHPLLPLVNAATGA